MVSVGIIGTGFGAKVQLPGFIGLPEARVIGIASKDSKRSEEFAKQHMLPRSFSSWQELIDCEEVQLVSIATPPYAHEELVSAVIKAGKHILCEKPFTLNAEQAENLLRKADEAKIIHAIDFEFRELSALLLLHEKVRGGALGNIVSAEFEWVVGTWADPTFKWRWQSDKDLGGGIIGSTGVHLFDAAEWLLGPIKAVKADQKTTITERPDGAGGMKPVTSEDTAIIEVKTTEDVLVHLKVSNVDPNGKGLTIRIVGEQGSLTLLSASQTYGSGLSVIEKKGDGEKTILSETPAPPGSDARIPPFQSLASRLLKAIQSRDHTFKPSFVEGMRSQQLRSAALVSEGGWVDIG